MPRPPAPGAERRTDEVLLARFSADVRANWKLVVRTLCERDWTHVLPNLLTLRSGETKMLARFEPLAPDLTFLDVDQVAHGPGPDHGGLTARRVVREAAAAVEALRSSGPGEDRFEHDAFLEMLDDALVRSLQREEAHSLSDDV